MDIKDIRLKVVGSQLYDGVLKDKLEFFTEGQLYKKGDIKYLEYEETPISGFEGYKTKLIMDGDSIKVKRYSETDINATELNFEKGKRSSGFYYTPYGEIDIEVLTNNLVNTISDEGVGVIDIDYDISLKGVLEGRNRLNIELS